MDAVTSRETLEAFVDGALSPEESARVVLRLADNPEDAAYVDALMELNALLGAAFSEPLNQAVPERIRATIFPAAAVAGAGAAAAGPARSGSRTARPGWRGAVPSRRSAGAWAAVAAAAVLAVGLVVGPWRGEQSVQIAGATGADDELRVALEEQPSGPVATTADEKITLIATFADRLGRPCREYEILHDAARAVTRGVACRSPETGWATEVAVASRLPTASSGEGYVPAQGEESDALDGALDRLGAGMLLTAGEERALIASNWRR